MGQGRARRLRRLLVDIEPLRRDRDYRWRWGGQVVSGMGTQITRIALPYQVYVLTGSTLAVGMLALVQLVVDPTARAGRTTACGDRSEPTQPSNGVDRGTGPGRDPDRHRRSCRSVRGRFRLLRSIDRRAPGDGSDPATRPRAAPESRRDPRGTPLRPEATSDPVDIRDRSRGHDL